MLSTLSRRKLLKIMFAAGGGVALAACGGNAAPPTPTRPPSTGVKVNLDIGTQKPTGDRYDTEKLEAPAGSTITVNFTNNSKEPKLYNWVLTQPGKSLKVANDGAASDEANDYIKPNDANVIAHTKMAKPGETVSVTFEAPSPGSYPYVCTFPGYFASMVGMLVVK